MILPQEYVVQKFCQYAGYPRYSKHTNVWAAGCPICREGTSWGKKRRLNYRVKKNYMSCFNCGWHGNPTVFIQEVTGMTWQEINAESKDYDILPEDAITSNTPTAKTTNIVDTLPKDSINLLDINQVSYWNNSEPVQKAIASINGRKLDTACNKPKTLWISLTDYTHKNRLILPFYDENNNIVFYQSRSLYKEDEIDRPKYLSKAGGEKTLFNINQVDPKLSKLFIFEGPIDSCFVKNGIAVGGIQESSESTFTSLQQQQLERYRLFDKIWVLDSQWLDTASYKKTQILLDQGETVFIWPESIGTKFKDLNDLCVAMDTPGIGYKFIQKNSYTDIKGKLLLNQIRPL